MRPKVSQACETSQSGSCSLIDAVRPAADATSSHANAQQKKKNTSGAVDASAFRRSASSGRAESAVGAVSTRARCAALSDGSSGLPISPGAKITSAPLTLLSSRPLRWLQMKTSRATTDRTNADSRMATVLMGISSGVLCASFDASTGFFSRGGRPAGGPAGTARPASATRGRRRPRDARTAAAACQLAAKPAACPSAASG